MPTTQLPVIILGASPAGLSAAWELLNNERPAILWEADAKNVGGGSQTIQKNGYRFDATGRQFHASDSEVFAFWKYILGDDLQEITAEIAVYNDGHRFTYPLEFRNIVKTLGWRESYKILASYIHANINPRPEKSFDAWVINHYGEKLYERFYKGYVEKIWGRDSTEATPVWAGENIQPLKLSQALRLTPKSKAPKKSFFYPKYGPSQMWDAVAKTITENGGKIEFNRQLKNLHWDSDRGPGFTHVTACDDTGRYYQCEGSHFISTLSPQEIIPCIDPPPPREVIAAAKGLRYHHLLTVCVVLKSSAVNASPYHWAHIYDPKIRATRVFNYKLWSPALVPDPSQTALGIEYLCDNDSPIWAQDNHGAAVFAVKELVQLKIIKEDDLQDAFVLRVKEAYPLRNPTQVTYARTVRNWLADMGNFYGLGTEATHKFLEQNQLVRSGIDLVQSQLVTQPEAGW